MFWRKKTDEVKQIQTLSACSAAAASSAAVSSCALARLSTAMARNTFSSVSCSTTVKLFKFHEIRTKIRTFRLY